MTLNLKPADEPTEKLLRIRINERDYGGHGYFPKWHKWPRHPQDKSTPVKLNPGDVADLPIEEAKELIKNRIAERADPLPE